MKRKKLVKRALEHPELYNPAELVFFEKWLAQKKEHKAIKKNQKDNNKDDSN